MMHSSSFRYSPRRKASNTPLNHPVLALAVLSVLLSACTIPDHDADLHSNQAQSSSASSMPSSMEDMPADGTASSAEAARSSSSLQAQAQQASLYTDGTYTADGSYRSPAGEESVTVSVTIDGGVVTAVTTDTESNSEKSRKFKGLFAAGVGQAVVGKSIDELSLTVVNGSSLTPGGFMDALAKIKAEASA